MELEKDWEDKPYCQRCKMDFRNALGPYCNRCYEKQMIEMGERLKEIHWHLLPGAKPPYLTPFEKLCLFRSECEECNRAIGL